jgi:hypothetical protein
MSAGLNKEARLIAQREALDLEGKRLPLNPPFPYQIEPFPAGFFGVENYSDAPPDKKFDTPPA